MDEQMVQNSSKEEQEGEREEEKEKEKKLSITNFNTPITHTAMKTVMGRETETERSMEQDREHRSRVPQICSAEFSSRFKSNGAQ